MDKRMRMNRIKNIKELQALQREIELMRQTNGELEEDLIKIMQEIDVVKAQIQTKNRKWRRCRRRGKRTKMSCRWKFSGIDAAVSEAATRRQSIASQVTGDLISRYELIFSRRGGTAVVEVTGGFAKDVS